MELRPRLPGHLAVHPRKCIPDRDDHGRAHWPTGGGSLYELSVQLHRLARHSRRPLRTLTQTGRRPRTSDQLILDSRVLGGAHCNLFRIRSLPLSAASCRTCKPGRPCLARRVVAKLGAGRRPESRGPKASPSLAIRLCLRSCWHSFCFRLGATPVRSRTLGRSTNSTAVLPHRSLMNTSMLSTSANISIPMPWLPR